MHQSRKSRAATAEAEASPEGERIQAQIVIPVHTLDRPIRRAVESVLASPGAGAVVVAHGIDPAELDLPDDPRVRVISLNHSVGYPGAAFNAGLADVTAPWSGVMGSDDWYEPGAIDIMVARASADAADGIIAPLRHANAEHNGRNPVTWRHSHLRGGRDGLFYRSAPLGLFRTEIFRDPSFLFADDVVAGVDQLNGVLLYTSGLSLSHYPHDPAYVVGEDAKTRVTTTVRPLSQHGEAWKRLWEDDRVRNLPRRERLPLARKFAQVHILRMLAARPEADQWLEGDFEWLSDLAWQIETLEPAVSRSFVRARAQIWEALLRRDMEEALNSQRTASYLDWRLPAYPAGVGGKDSWLRTRLDSRLADLRDSVDSLLATHGSDKRMYENRLAREDFFVTSPNDLRSQIVIPVHTVDRPIRRAVDSVLADPESGAIVVAHNVAPDLLDLPEDERVTVVPLEGHAGKPGAAFDAGIAAATAPWVGIMGSDDWYEAGALRAMRARADKDGADIVIVPLAYQGGERGFIPQTLRHRNLQAARDRLFYRTAPLGLIRRDIIQNPDYAFGSRLFIGEDVTVSARLWTDGYSVSYGANDPAYVVGTDAKMRTTLTPRPLAEQGAAWLAIWDQPWVAEMDSVDREALAVKILRVHVHGAVAARPQPEDWQEGDFEWLTTLTRRIVQESPNVLASFRSVTQDTLRAVAEGDLDRTLAHYREEDGAPVQRRLLPARASELLKPDGPVRTQMTVLGHAGSQALRDVLPESMGGLHLSVVPGGPPKPTDVTKPTLLILSFSPIRRDARVLRQVNLFRDRYNVVTCGFEEAPDGVIEHIQLPADLLPTAIDGRLITAHQYWAAYWNVPAIKNARAQLRGRQFDAVLANDVEAVPLALDLQPTKGVHADLHEHFPSLQEDNEAWRRRISPYMSWLMKRYVSQVASTTTVSSGLQRAYQAQFGFLPGLVPNATPYADLSPTPVTWPIRLVHSAACQRKRHLEIMLEAVDNTSADVTLDLFVTPNDPAYLQELKATYGSHSRITLHDPVPYSELVATLNTFDVGVHLLPPVTFSHRWALPNKFFDFIQARLGIIVGPSPEMAPLVEDNDLGAVCEGFTAEDLEVVLATLTPEKVARWKHHSDQVALDFSGERATRPWEDALTSLLS